MNSPDSWIDLQEIAQLVRQILPEEDADPSSSSSSSSKNPSDTPTSLFADKEPVNPANPAWPILPADMDAEFPDLDELQLPADPDTLLTQDSPIPGLRSRAENALRAVQAFAGTGAAADTGQEATAPGTDETTPIPEAPPTATVPKDDPAPGEPAPRLEDPHFHMPEGPLRVRLGAYVDWVRRVTGCDRLMLSDGQGYSLLQQEDQNDPAVVGSALQITETLAQVRHRMDADTARSGVYIPLGEMEWFGVLECDSKMGTVCLSMVTQAPLAKTAAEELIRTLRETLDA